MNKVTKRKKRMNSLLKDSKICVKSYHKPRSSSWLSLDLELNPKAACQSSQLDTGIESAISVVGTSGTSAITM